MVILPLKSESSEKVTFGIIDGNLSFAHTNIRKINNNINCNSLQHGDNILNFLEELVPYETFFYYNAELNGKISSESIIDGLNWMLVHNVKNVSISLSSKEYSSELENWIYKNSDRLTIYASYNNVANTYDYPARYEKVIGVGLCDTPDIKQRDIIFNSYKLIIISRNFKVYKGTSYLTPYVMMKNRKG